MTQRHFSLSATATDNLSLQKQEERQLRTMGSVNNLVPAKTMRLLSDDSETIGEYVYRKVDQIGSGYSSIVYRCRSLKREGEFALKVIDTKKYSSSSLQMLENQIVILQKLSHPNILRLENVYKHAYHCYLVTEYCPEGDLLDYITRNGKLCEKQAVAIIHEVIEAVKYLFTMGIIHRDIKPANIFKSHKSWKLGDFGFAIKAEGEVKTKQNVGTPLYMPLESLQRNLYSPESDIFAVGIICYEMMVGLTPWQSKSEKELVRKMSTVPFSIPQKCRVTSPLKFLLGKICQPNRDDRMTKEEFMDLNVNNFASLITFNQHLKASEYQRKARIFSVGKLQRDVLRKSEKPGAVLGQSERNPSRGKGQPPQKEGQVHRKNSKNEMRGVPKVELRSSSKNKIVDIKSYGNRRTSHSKQSHMLDPKIEQNNYEVLVVQLNYCRFMYYLLENGAYLQLSSSSRGKLTLVLFKHLLKVAKQLADSKSNCFGLTEWDSFRKSAKYAHTIKTLRDYCQKYQKQYLIFLKKAEINVIKDVNHKLPEFTSADPFTLSFYKKILGYIHPLLKECSHGLLSLSQLKGEEGRMEALRGLYRYFKLVEMSMNQFQNYSHFCRHSGISVLKNYRESRITLDEYLQIQKEVKMI